MGSFQFLQVGDAVTYLHPKHGFRDEGHVMGVLRDQVRIQPLRQKGRRPEAPILLETTHVRRLEPVEPVRPRFYRGGR